MDVIGSQVALFHVEKKAYAFVVGFLVFFCSTNFLAETLWALVCLIKHFHLSFASLRLAMVMKRTEKFGSRKERYGWQGWSDRRTMKWWFISFRQNRLPDDENGWMCYFFFSCNEFSLKLSLLNRNGHFENGSNKLTWNDGTNLYR